MLTPHMRFGYGVAEAIRRLDVELRRFGISSVVGCLTVDEHFPEIDTRRVDPTQRAVLDLAERHRAEVVVAHGSPFFEVLPGLGLPTVAYEYGDPTPELFTADADARRAIVTYKATHVYPGVTAVAAISDFVRHDIAVPTATVIRLGADHVPDLGIKTDVGRARGPLRVGTLMRLGAGESHYKGTSLLPDLRARLEKHDVPFEFHVAGRGTPQEAATLRREGFHAHVNLDDDQRVDYLRGLDVFVSLSLWEGMNLPLVEAAALGTPALALDTGAHPEFSPLIYSGVEGMAAQLEAYANRPGLLEEHGQMSYRYVRRRFTWSACGAGFAALLLRVAGPPLQQRPVRVRYRVARNTARRRLREVGLIRATRTAVRQSLGNTSSRH